MVWDFPEGEDHGISGSFLAEYAHQLPLPIMSMVASSGSRRTWTCLQLKISRMRRAARRSPRPLAAGPRFTASWARG